MISSTTRFCILSFIFIFLACQNKNKSKTSNESKIQTYSVEIEKPSKEEITPNYIAPIFKVAQFREYPSIQTIVLSNQHLSRKAEVVPIGMFRYEINDQVEEILLSLEVRDNKRTLEIKNFLGFATQYSSVKQMIELYYTNQHGLGKVKSFKWMNEVAALRKINLSI